MSADQVAIIPRCAECEARWLPADEERWQAHLGCDEHIDEPPELVFYCPECAEREFGGAPLEVVAPSVTLGGSRHRGTVCGAWSRSTSVLPP